MAYTYRSIVTVSLVSYTKKHVYNLFVTVSVDAERRLVNGTLTFSHQSPYPSSLHYFIHMPREKSFHSKRPLTYQKEIRNYPKKNPAKLIPLVCQFHYTPQKFIKIILVSIKPSQTLLFKGILVPLAVIQSMWR